MSQNLLFLNFTDEQLLAVDDALTALEAALPGLISLTVDQRKDTSPGGISEGYGIDEVGNLATLRQANQLDPPRRGDTYDGMNRLSHVREGASRTLRRPASTKQGALSGKD